MTFPLTALLIALLMLLLGAICARGGNSNGKKGPRGGFSILLLLVLLLMIGGSSGSAVMRNPFPTQKLSTLNSQLSTVLTCDGTAADCQAKVNTAQNGDTVTIPAGTFTWSTPVTITKAIKLQGAGSGRIIGNTKSNVAIGIGSKTFETTRPIPGITAGQTLRIAKMPNSPDHGEAGRENYMEGTVTSYSGTTLVLNVTQTGGGGTYKFWWIATKPRTTIVNNYDNGSGNSNATPMLKLTTGVEVEGIQFAQATTGRSSTIGLFNSSSGKAKIYDCWFQTGLTHGQTAIYAQGNQYVIWECSYDDLFNQTQAFLVSYWLGTGGRASHDSNSTMGMADTNGLTNGYIEDCDFHGTNQIADFADASRVVFRRNLMDNAGCASHGEGATGVRHVEVYDNELVFDVFAGDCTTTLDVPHFFWLRGGTGVFTDNNVPIINSCHGGKSNIKFSWIPLRRRYGQYCCGVGYPQPHQPGQGFGPGAECNETFQARCGTGTYPYCIYAEPIYVWNNRGTGGNNVGLTQDATDQCGNNQQIGDYIRAGRDYKIEPKPGYQKFTYPHPARNGGGASPTPTPTPSATATATPSPAPSPTPTSTAAATPTATVVPSPTPSPSSTPSASVTPTPGQCTVPNLVGRRINSASYYWTLAGFDCRNITTIGAATSTIRSQTLAAGSQADCATATITVTSGR